jgi:DNA-binding transcriptional ArsR family regulator
MSRQAVTKHLRLLEDANLVVTKWQGREKLHYLNPVPINEIYTRWIGRFEQERLHALQNLKQVLKEKDHE